MDANVCSLLLLVSFVYGCNNASEESRKENQLVKSATKVASAGVSPKPVVSPGLKNITINEAYFTKKTAAARGLTKDEIHQLNLTSLFRNHDGDVDSSAKLKVIDTLLASPNKAIYIISLEIENENWAWLVQYNEANKIIFSQKVYYADFVEYYETINTSVEGNRIEVTKETSVEGENTKEVKTHLRFSENKIEQTKPPVP